MLPPHWDPTPPAILPSLLRHPPLFTGHLAEPSTGSRPAVCQNHLGAVKHRLPNSPEALTQQVWVGLMILHF